MDANTATGATPDGVESDNSKNAIMCAMCGKVEDFFDAQDAGWEIQENLEYICNECIAKKKATADDKNKNAGIKCAICESELITTDLSLSIEQLAKQHDWKLATKNNEDYYICDKCKERAFWCDKCEKMTPHKIEERTMANPCPSRWNSDDIEYESYTCECGEYWDTAPELCFDEDNHVL